MKTILYNSQSGRVSCVLGASLANELAEFDPANVIIITDENVDRYHADIFTPYKKIILSPGEKSKSQKTIDSILLQMLEWECDRNTVVAGCGGGVVTDIAGYVASIYKRGVKLLLSPTSLLAMVDAAIGGKNGINLEGYKNMVGTVYQPTKIVYDFSLLRSLPEEEWQNGFAETIKHACIKDKALFAFLEGRDLEHFMQDKAALSDLVEKNVAIKSAVIENDELETGERKLLNFGHTTGHAIENVYGISHGNAISIGMAIACKFSEEMNGFWSEDKDKVISLLKKYGLPVQMDLDKEKIWEAMIKDKKRDKDTMHFILLNKIGEGAMRPISLVQLHSMIKKL